MRYDGKLPAMSVRDVAAAADFRNADIQRHTGGLGRLETRIRQDDRVHYGNCIDAVGPRKLLPSPICPSSRI